MTAADAQQAGLAAVEDEHEPPSGTGALVCWRPGRDRRKGLIDVLIGRTSHDGDRGDQRGWTLPRADRRVGETLPQAAVRALTEHPADDVRLVPRLARPLHRVGDTTFWAARLRERENRPPVSTGPDSDQGAARDELTWMPAEAAGGVLSDPDDRAAVDAALIADGSRHLDTRPLLVVRHAKARPRSRWSHADAERPLVDLGRRQAFALAGLLECWHPEFLLSSPWQRCVETVMPYVAAHGLRVRTRGGLSEQAHRSSPGKAARHLRTALGSGEAALVCTHRPVLPTVLSQLAQRATPHAVAQLPTEDPYLTPAEVLVAHVAVRTRSGTPCVLAVELHRPLD